MDHGDPDTGGDEECISCSDSRHIRQHGAARFCARCKVWRLWPLTLDPPSCTPRPASLCWYCSLLSFHCCLSVTWKLYSCKYFYLNIFYLNIFKYFYSNIFIQIFLFKYFYLNIFIWMLNLIAQILADQSSAGCCVHFTYLFQDKMLLRKWILPFSHHQCWRNF